MFFDLSDKLTFITGGASGIGLAIARRFCTAGARVVIADLQDGTELARELGGAYLRLDVSDGEAVAQALADTAATDGKIDILDGDLVNIWCR